MAKLTLSEAARACNVARTTIQRAVKTGRLALDAEHRVDTAELLRIGYQLDAAVLHAASQQPPVAMQQDAAAADARCCTRCSTGMTGSWTCPALHHRNRLRRPQESRRSADVPRVPRHTRGRPRGSQRPREGP
jgi:hypothetical protein